MDHKQLFAKIGVFVLLGANVAAYYVLWPRHDAGAKSEAKARAEEKGAAQLLPEKAPAIGLKGLPAEIYGVAEPLHVSNPPVKPKEKTIDEVVTTLQEHIKNETETGDPAVVKIPSPPDIGPAWANADRPLPALPQEKRPNLGTLMGEPKAGNADVVVASAMTPKFAPSPWLLNMEMVGNQTHLIAKLRHGIAGHPAIEFKIVCDRIEIKAPGAVQAFGNVTCVGVGMNASCQRLTLPLQEIQLVFEERVQIVDPTDSRNNLRGDRLIWEPGQKKAETQPPVIPADFRPNDSVAPFPAGLGQPK